jgi:hypothetical protein
LDAACGLPQKVEQRAPSLFAGRHECPDPFKPPLPSSALATFGHAAVNDQESYRPRGNILRRLQAWRREKPQIADQGAKQS